MDRLPPVLRRKLRAYRLAAAAVALLETIAAAALLSVVAGPRGAPLAVLWLAWRAWRWPSAYVIAREWERRDPALAETLSATIQFARSRDPEPLQGSPALRAQLFAEADRRATSLPIARSVPWKPAVALGLAAATALVVAHPFRQPGTPAVPTHQPPLTASPPPTAGTAEPPTARRVSLAELQGRLAELERQLAALPDHVRRELPAYARSLDQAREATLKAEAALARGDAAEAEFLMQSAAELLAEFARLAASVPELTTVAATAKQLAGQYAAAAPAAPELPSTQPVTPTGAASGPAATHPPGPAALVGTATSRLPAAPTDVAWTGPAPARAAGVGFSGTPLPGYEQPIRDYLERLAHIGN